MATYLRIGPVGSKSDIRIAGDVTAKRHEGWIEISSFGFGTQAGGGGGEDGDDSTEDGEATGDGEKPGSKEKGRSRKRSQSKASAEDLAKSGSQRFRESGLTLEKPAGSESPKLLDWALQGKVYDLQIDCCREGSEPFMSVFVHEARVTSLSQDADDEEIREEVSILFKTIEFQATGFSKDMARLSPNGAKTVFDESVAALPPTAAPRLPGAAAIGNRGRRMLAEAALEKLMERARRAAESAEFIQEDRVLAIDSIGGTEFKLGSLVGSEGMSNLFQFRLEVTSKNLAVTAPDVIGKPVGFRIEDHSSIDSDRKSAAREFHGIVAEMHVGQKGLGYRDYTLVVVPSMWLLTKRMDCRIFQKKSVVEIIEAVFQKISFKDYDKSNLTSSYPKLDFCVQYRESDFDFVNRLMEENGIFYFFRFTKGSHKLILADSAAAHANCEQREVSQSRGGMDGKHVNNWFKRLRHVSGKVVYRDYNHTAPGSNLASQATCVVKLPGNAPYEIYDYPGRYLTVSEGQRLAKVRMEAEEVAHCVVEGDGGCDAFACGVKFKVKEHECDEERGQEYVLTSVNHQVRLLPMSDLKPRLYYENQFECIPKSVTFRSEASTRRPSIAGPQTAVVVGVSSEEIDPDKYGAVKVQFHWDRDGKKDENSSCFVRVAQPVAGKNWGGLWLPRIGQEVVVEFLEGDPDRPLITGSVYNEDNLPPYALPANKTQSVIKTRSTKDGKAENFNELRFEDKLGSEHVYFHAEKDFQRVVENDDTLTVGKDSKGNQVITIEKDRTLTVKEGNESYTVKKGNRTVTVETGNVTLTIEKGNDTTKVNQGSSSTEAKQNIELKVGSNTIKIDQSGKITSEASQSIELKVGSNSIKIDTSGVTVTGTKVAVDGSTSTDLQGGGAKVSLAGGIVKLG